MALPSIFVSDPQGLSIGLSDDTRHCEVYNHVPAYHGLSDSVTPKDSVSELGSYSIAASSTVDSGYGGSEETRSTPSRPRDNNSLKEGEEALWRCRSCQRSFRGYRWLRQHERNKHVMDDWAAGHRWREESSFLEKTEDDIMTRFMESNLRESKDSPWRISKPNLVGTPIMVDLLYKLGSCLSELSSLLPNRSPTLLVHKIDGVTINITVNKYDKTDVTINVYDTVGPKPSNLPTSSGTAQLGHILGDVKRFEQGTQTEELQSPPSPRQVPKVRRRCASLPMDHDNTDAFMDQQPIPTIEAPEIMSNPHTPLVLPPLEDSAHSSSKDEVKLMDNQEHDTTDKLYKAKVSKKRDNPDDDASHCSGSLVDSSEEGDDSDYEHDNIFTWNYSQHDALPSFLPYIRGCDENTSSLCSDSPESGSTTSGTPRDTPASSSASGLAGGNSLQGNGYTPPNAGTGFPNNGDSPVLRTKEEFRAKVAKPQPRPLICWYPAAGIACDGKNVSSSPNTRYLWRDHALGKSPKAPNHRLSVACQLCKRLFLTKQLLAEHIENVARRGLCRAPSDVEQEDFNREPNRLGISLECEDAVEEIRTYIDKEMKGKKLPALRGGDIEKLLSQRVDINVLNQRVDSNVLLYINGSYINEKTARSELWKWYLIFKKLRPDDELPENPFVPAQLLVEPEGKSRADALCTFMQVFDQRRMEGWLPELDEAQRTALTRVFLDAWDMLVVKKASKRHRSTEMRNPRKRQKRSPPEDHEPTRDSADPTLAPTTPVLAPAPIPGEIPPSVQDAVNIQHPTFTFSEVQNQVLPQTSPSVPQSFMPSDHDFWPLQRQQLQQEAEEAHSRFDADFDFDQFVDSLPEAPKELYKYR